MNVAIKELLEAGVHFGHQTRRWNPKMKKFIFTAKSGIYIIDLQKTLQCLEKACSKVREVAGKGLPILFVGTKKQAKQLIREEAERCGEFYVCERWLGGMLTNYHTIRNSVRNLKDLERMKEDGTFDKLPKKEVLKLEKEITKLNKILGGIKEMGRLPGLIYVVDSKKERIAVLEANKLKIPVVAIIDTNSDPDIIDFPVAGNDDSVKSIKVISGEITGAILEEKTKMEQVESERSAKNEKLTR